MTTPAQRRGSGYERGVVAWLRENGFPYARRAYGAGVRDDVGDVSGLPGVVLELKAQHALRLAEWVKEAERERVNAEAEYGIVVHKYWSKSTADSYCTLPLWQLAKLLSQAGY